MKHALKMALYRLGRRLMQANYTDEHPQRLVEHDLRLQVRELTDEVRRLRVRLSVERTKRAIV